MKNSKTLLALTALAATAVAPLQSSASSVVPYHRMAAADLAPQGYDHHAVLRIGQDFHPDDDYEISIDAWVQETKPDALAAVRMWWLDTSDADARSPFGRGVRRHIDIDYDQREAGWDIRIKQGRKSYIFNVDLDDGRAVATTTVRAHGEQVEDCRITRSRLVAKKVLGISTGLRRIDVTCTDEDGKQHRGSVVSR